MKKKSMESKHTDSIVKKMFQAQQSVKKKVILIAFWDMKGSMTDFIKKCNSASYCQLLRKNSPNSLNDACISCLMFWDEPSWFLSYRVFGLHLYFYIHNISADMSSGLLQMFVKLRSLHRTLNHFLYLIHGGCLFWFC